MNQPGDQAREAAPPGPHTRITAEGLIVDGVPFHPFGGEFQYFRVRDADWDGPRTHELWAARLDTLRAAGLNTISTYIPWDYHAPEAGRYDWSGPRDVGRFLELAAERGFKLIVKPGPFILAEWPHGFGSYGAVPLWWRSANKEALVRDRRRKIFHWHPVAPRLARFDKSLPSYASETFRTAVGEWFEALCPHLRDHLGPGGAIIAVQLDNETNLFWSDLYRIDWHKDSIRRYRERLLERYGSASRLSSVYGRPVKTFEEVWPPARAGDGPDVRHRDWIDHLQALVKDYLGALKAHWTRLDVTEPDVIFLTNDTPQTFAGRTLLLPHGETKATHGLYCVDTYPRAFPLPSSALFDVPYQPEVASKLFGFWNRRYTGGPAVSLGIEVQGGHFSIPLPLPRRPQLQPHKVLPEATRQTLLRLRASGMQGIVVYTATGGLNLDGSPFDFQAALGLDGEERPRLEALRWFAWLLEQEGGALKRAMPIESEVALLASGHQLGPGSQSSGEQRIFGEVLRGLYGWFAAAGFSPAVADLTELTPEDFRRFKVLVLPSSGAISDECAERLRLYVEEGGTLLQLFSPGPLRSTLFPAVAVPAPRGLFGRVADLTGVGRLWRSGARARFQVERAVGSFDLELPRGTTLLKTTEGTRSVLHLADRPELCLGYQRSYGKGRAIFLATSPGDVFASKGYYTHDSSDLTARALFLRRLLRSSGVRRLLACGAQAEAHAMRDPHTGTLLVAIFSSRQQAGGFHLRLRQTDALGLDRETSYEVVALTDDKTGKPLARLTGLLLREQGVRLSLPAYGTALLVVRPAD